MARDEGTSLEPRCFAGCVGTLRSEELRGCFFTIEWGLGSDTGSEGNRKQASYLLLSCGAFTESSQTAWSSFTLPVALESGMPVVIDDGFRRGFARFRRILHTKLTDIPA